MSATKIVTDEDLAELYQRLLPYLNGNALSYSTSEQDTGKRWIDGKKIYQKTVNFGALPNATAKRTAHGISNIDKVISIQGFASDSENNSIPIPYVATSDASTYSILMSREGSNIRIDAKTNWSTYNAYIILEYTKTS